MSEDREIQPLASCAPILVAIVLSPLTSCYRRLTVSEPPSCFFIIFEHAASTRSHTHDSSIYSFVFSYPLKSESSRLFIPKSVSQKTIEPKLFMGIRIRWA